MHLIKREKHYSFLKESGWMIKGFKIVNITIKIVHLIVLFHQDTIKK